MLTKRDLLRSGATTAFAVAAAKSGPVLAQALTGAPALPDFKFSTSAPPGIECPDKVETRFGTLNFFDGFPDKTSAEKLFRQPRLPACRAGIPARNSSSEPGCRPQCDPQPWAGEHSRADLGAAGRFADDRAHRQRQHCLQLGMGRSQQRVRSCSKCRQRCSGRSTTSGSAGSSTSGSPARTRAQGGKYLLLPPGYKGEVPTGYHVVRSPTFNLWLPWRSFLVDGDPKPGVDLVKKHTKIYPLADAGKLAPALKYVNMSGKPFNMVNPADYAVLGAAEPGCAGGADRVARSDPARLLRVHRHPEGQAVRTRRADEEDSDRGRRGGRRDGSRHRLPHAGQGSVYYYEHSNWQLPFIGGYKFQAEPGVLNLDGYILYYFMATGVTPAMEEKMVGRGSQYAWTARDAKGEPLDGGKNYKLHLPPNIPVKDFWSVILYSNQTRSMIQTDQRFPSVSSQTKGLLVNPDGSVDVYFGPKRPAGKENNWVQTVPGRGWNTILRLYGPLEPWFAKTWRPGEIELQS